MLYEVITIRVNGQEFPLTSKNQAGSSGLREYRSALPTGTTAIEGEYLNIAVIVLQGEGVLLPDDA